MTVPQLELSDLPTDVALLDVRENDEWNAGHIEGALHVPMNLVPTKLDEEPGTIDRTAPVVVVCHSGSRSAHVTAWLVQNGYDAYNLAGGMLAWAAAGRPMTAADGITPHVD